jgi:excisionase family DNA binding protein
MNIHPDWPSVPVITAAHAAALLGIHEETLYRALKRGDLAGYKSGRAQLIFVASLRRWPGPLPEGRPRLPAL